MRIQHNIMAMNAYRNYTNNVAAMKSNLEKLSSGYKINRAGDDAAGLAISEKMRAQITGLETAQKNAKDGISLVQTAEGALTEVHDMLNRMVELATQSANGTYSDKVDREQLQKEIVQLKDEINRIADSSNFNGIKLLDGSMSGREAQTIVDSVVTPGTLTNFGVGASSNGLPSVGSVLGTNTVLHVDKPDPSSGTEFSIDLHNVGFTNESGVTMAINIGGGNTILITGNGGKAMNGSELAAYIVDAFENGNTNVKFNSNTLTGGNEFLITNGGVGVSCNISTATTASGAGDDRLVFTQISMPTSTSDTLDGRMNVTITGDGAQRADMMTPEYTVSTGGGGNAAVTVETSMDLNQTTFAATVALNGATIKLTTGDSVVGDMTITLSATATASNGLILAVTSDATANKWYFIDEKGRKAEEVTATSILARANKALNVARKDKIDDYLATTLNADGNLSQLDKDIAAPTVAVVGTITLTANELDNNAAAAPMGTQPTNDVLKYTVADGTTADYNVKTTYVNNKTADDKPRLASTKFTLDASMVEENSSIYIGGSDYVFTSDKAVAASDVNKYVYIGDLGPNKDGKDLTDDDLEKVADRLATAAKGNTVYSVGNESGSKVITVTEIEDTTQPPNNDKGVKTGADGEKFDLKTKEGIEKSLGFRVGNKVETTTTEIEAGKKLTLQIGDTAEAFNQLSVAIKDCHVDAIGIGDVDISTQEGAAAAVDMIKNAINYVSDVRGTLGATQNRLDHTINNLSVMTENIQDAESTIRDTDVADEMMAYTKNNILIQSAQAMLAQANQVPQGVLQLLQ